MWQKLSDDELRKYRSVMEWREENGIPFLNQLSEQDSAVARNQWEKLRERLWSEHCETLPLPVKTSLDNQTHPRFDWANPDRSKPYAKMLQEHLESLGFKCSVIVGDLGGTNCLDAFFDEVPSRKSLLRVLPYHFMGFDVAYVGPQTSNAPSARE